MKFKYIKALHLLEVVCPTMAYFC